VTPPETLVSLLPGTLAELVERTGWSAEGVMKQITRARINGARVNAVMQPRSDEGEATTMFTLDDASQPEVS